MSAGLAFSMANINKFYKEMIGEKGFSFNCADRAEHCYIINSMISQFIAKMFHLNINLKPGTDRFVVNGLSCYIIMQENQIFT